MTEIQECRQTKIYEVVHSETNTNERERDRERAEQATIIDRRGRRGRGKSALVRLMQYEKINYS